MPDLQTDPGAAIQKAVYEALRASEALQSLIGDPARVFDRVPDNPAKRQLPYLSIGDDQQIGEQDGCHDLTETFVNVHIWSRAVGMAEAKRIAAAVRAILAPSDPDAAAIAPEGHSVRLHEFRSSRAFRDPDGTTTHGVVTVRYLTEPV